MYKKQTLFLFGFLRNHLRNKLIISLCFSVLPYQMVIPVVAGSSPVSHPI